MRGVADGQRHAVQHERERGHGERSRLQLLFKLAGRGNMLILAVNALAVNTLAVNGALLL